MAYALSDTRGLAWPAIETALTRDRAPGRFIAAVRRRVEQVRRGDQGWLAESTLEPVTELPSIDQAATGLGEAALERVVVIKLNGGLATSMGLTGPKSLVPVRNQASFLDLVVQQMLTLHGRARVPLVLMNSFATHASTSAALDRYPELTAQQQQLPTAVVQHRLPKLDAQTLAPISWTDDAKRWCPPGHGDLYLTLATSGLLAALLDHGIEYAFVSNIDNLGATLDPALLGQCVRDQLPFLMEVTERTPTDRKGGHLARRRADGRLTLRELAQCPEADRDQFQDITRHRYFNTNSLWLHLPTVASLLATGDSLVDLPLIVNRKTVDPADPSSPAVLQLETAMGTAISAVPGAAAVCVPRRRFSPVKTTNELLIVRSDAYAVTATGELALVARRPHPPVVHLSEPYQRLSDFEARFPYGAPSLATCDDLQIDGDVTFGANVTIRGSVRLVGNQFIPDGTVLEG